MINVKTVLRKKKLSTGTFPICLRITKDRQTKYFKTLFNATEIEWDAQAGKFNNRNQNYLQNNRLINKFQDRALKIIGELELEQDDYSLDDIERKYRRPTYRQIIS